MRYRTASAKRRFDTAQNYRKRNVYGWQDPFPEVPGTAPEKMVFARLTLMRIPFRFQSYTTVNIPELNVKKDYRPDFIIPGLKLIIEVQGAYWHSMEKAIVDDAYKHALYQIMGFRVAAWWDYDILENLDGLFSADPQLNIYKGVYGDRIIIKDRQSYRDDLKGLRTLNAKKRKPYRTFIGTSRRRVRKSKASYEA